MAANSICLVSDDMIAVASNSESCLFLVELTLDGIGIIGAVKDFSQYPNNCKSVYAMCISNRTLVISCDKGIATIDMTTREQTILLSNSTPSCKDVRRIAPFGDQVEIVFGDMGSRKIKVYSNGDVEIIAGTGEEGNSDGTRASFSQLMGICVENGKNIFVTDAQVGAVKLITDVRCAIKFLENLGQLYYAFSMHHKHKRTHTSILQEAGDMMKTLSEYLQGTVQSAQTLLDRNRQTNGPEGTVASKTVKSVHMINKGLARLQSNITKINPELTLNPETLLTVKVGNLHAVSHFKHST